MIDSDVDAGKVFISDGVDVDTGEHHDGGGKHDDDSQKWRGGVKWSNLIGTQDDLVWVEVDNDPDDHRVWDVEGREVVGSPSCRLESRRRWGRGTASNAGSSQSCQGWKGQVKQPLKTEIEKPENGITIISLWLKYKKNNNKDNLFFLK